MESGVFLSGPVLRGSGGRKVPPSLPSSSPALGRPRRQRHQRESPFSRRVGTGDELTGPSWHFHFSRRLLNRLRGEEGGRFGRRGEDSQPAAASAVRSPPRYARPRPPLLRSVASGRGYPRRGRAGHPRRGNTPRFHACPLTSGAGGIPAPDPAPPRPPPRSRSGRLAAAGERQVARRGRAGMRWGEKAAHRGNRPAPAARTRGTRQGGAGGRLRRSPSEGRGDRSGDGGRGRGAPGGGAAAWARRGPRGRAVPAAPHSTPCAEEAVRGRGRGPATMGLAGAINTRPHLYLVWPDHNRGGTEGGVQK